MFQVNETTVVDADTYFATRLNAEAWQSATPEVKLSALTTASVLLADYNHTRWLGRPLSAGFPFPAFMPGYSVAVTPTRVKWALYEQALHLLINPSVLNEEESVESVVLGPVELTAISVLPVVPKFVVRLLAPYASHGKTWWRAN